MNIDRIDRHTYVARMVSTGKGVLIQAHLGYGRCIVENAHTVAGQPNRFVVSYNELTAIFKE